MKNKVDDDGGDMFSCWFMFFFITAQRSDLEEFTEMACEALGWKIDKGER